MQAQQTVQCLICNQNIYLSAIQTHQQNCLLQYEKKNINKLKSAHAVTQIIPCLQCGESIPFELYNFHIAECQGNKMQLCEKCGTIFPKSIFLEHKQNCKQKQQELYHNSQQQDINPQQFQFEEKIKPKGLTKTQIANLQTAVILNNKDIQCSICQMKMTQKDRVVRLGCGHKFHRKCVIPWLQENPKCPMCRIHALTVIPKKKKEKKNI